MAADYDRLFQPSDEADAAEDAGGYGDFDVDGPFPTPPGPPSTPQPNGHGASPMPIDPPVQPPPAAAPEHPLMPVDLAAPPPPAAARPPMPVDYDRLFEPPAGTDTSDGPGADATYDPDVPAPTPPTPTNAPKPNGQTPPPMPVHWPEQSPPEHPPMPVDLTAAPPPPTRPEPPGPKERNQVAKQPPRHARQGPAEVPNLQLGRARSHNSHRAAPQPGKGNAPGPSLPSRPLISAHADSAPATASSEPATRPTAGKPAARPVSRRGWRRWVRTLTRINLGLSRDEKYALELQNRIRRPIHGSYEIGVLGLKGGAGRTSVTAALGSAFAQVRGDRILAVDADPVSGDLVNRVGRQTAATVADLVANRALSHYNDVRAHTSVNAVNLEVLSAADYNGTRPLLSAEEWKRALGMVPRYYNLVVSDCGADLFSPAAHGVLAVASGLVVLSTASVDGVRQAAVALDWLRNNGYGALLDRACVVINHVVPGDSTNADSDVVRQFQRHVQPGRVIVLPWDEHIAAGTEVQFALLSTAYQRKIIELAAALSDDFDRSERR
ncbi:cellulose synthase operon protein YhjQ/BcsQ [Mycobacterium europaeum]|uniref:MinD/ParA family ATP-binding protein n=1 Tax=Mycobacterium europaeum TaxID=761804 RepID=UPI002ADFCA3E|nr:cellulose synthase operon protein YhjQ/BcsQ [Mycobacterium europaeum]MEA1157775.1 cellulose synthase operon protein YhjQ/BcsQ [Mycobacterium europaeum]